jgi:hypothetical protein
MSVFVSAIDDLFSDPNLALDAVYRADGGSDVPVRVMLRRPDRIGDFGETRLAAATTLVDIRVAEVAVPMEGDTVVIGGETFIVQGQPLRDVERLVWTLEVRPA